MTKAPNPDRTIGCSDLIYSM